MIIIVFGVPLPARMRCSSPCAPRQLPCRWFAAGLPLRPSSSWVSRPRAPRRPWRRCVVPRAPPMAALLAPPPASLPLVAPRALFGWVPPPWLTPSRLAEFGYSASTFPLCAHYLRCEPPRVPRGLPLSCVHSALRGFVNFVVRLCCCALLRACGLRPLNFLGFRATPSPSAGGLRHPVSVVWYVYGGRGGGSLPRLAVSPPAPWGGSLGGLCPLRPRASFYILGALVTYSVLTCSFPIAKYFSVV